MRRPDLSNRVLLGLVAGMTLALIGYFAILPSLPSTFRTPGSPILYLFGVSGAALLLVPMLFAWNKRSGRSESPPAWFNAHVIASCLGVVLIAIHSAGYLRRPPALLFLALFGLVVLGVWARLWLTHRVSGTFGSKHQSFAPLPAADKERLRALIEQKRTLLARLDPAAQEGTFSLTPHHWIGKPSLARQYAALVREERRLMGTRGMVPPEQAYWRALHIALAYLFALGLLVHIITVTFFAGYVADGGEITWWHITAW